MFLILAYSNVFEFSAAILEKGLLNGLVLSLRLFEGTETVSCPLSLRIARMEMDWNLKKFGQFFQGLKLHLQKIIKKFIMVSLFDHIHLISSSQLY